MKNVFIFTQTKETKMTKNKTITWTIVKKVDRGMRKISKAQPRHAGRTKVQSD